MPNIKFALVVLYTEAVLTTAAVKPLRTVLPEASLATMVEAPLADVAVVAELGIDVSNAPEPVKKFAVNPLKAALPAASLATMVEAPLADAAEVALFGIEAAVNPEPEPENDNAVIAPALNAPEASLATMVETVFAFVAVVLALAIVPVVTLVPLSVDMLTPGPLNPDPPDVIAPAAKLPEASLAIMVETLFASVAVVLALAIVPEVTLAPLSVDMLTPGPLNPVPPEVIAPAAKLPEASLAIMVETVFASVAVVLALATVPVVTLVPLSAVNNAPLPETAPVNIFAVTPLKATLPAASLATMVLAPLADAAVVAELGIDVSPAPEPVNNVEVIASTRIEAASWNAIVPKN